MDQTILLKCSSYYDFPAMTSYRLSVSLLAETVYSCIRIEFYIYAVVQIILTKS
jgi:hypothetical protein